MGLSTTTIGSFPKLDYVEVRDWFQTGYKVDYDARYFKDRSIETSLTLATRDAVLAQVNAGIDIPTEGEQRRENYIYYHCRHLTGIDFEHFTIQEMRSGAWEERVPTIIGKITAGEDNFLRYDWQIAQLFTDRPIKITIPGPMTIADTLGNDYYNDEQLLAKDLAAAINVEIKDLAAAGCKYIQVDEPVFARYPDKAIKFGIENLERCFYGTEKDVNRSVHICCGYPLELDQPDEKYEKADPASYFTLAKPLDESKYIDAVSIEDAHRHNDLSLLEHFKQTDVILGVIEIAKTRIETYEEIRERLIAAHEHIDANRLIAAPDCGLGMLDQDITIAKLESLVKAAQSIGS